jgi:alkylation response protein AidB-like acyl-CoA dehydrogenase
MTLAADSPIFDPASFRLGDFEADLAARARALAAERFAPRAAGFDRLGQFPTENYADLRAEGLLGICVPASYGGLGADYRAYSLAAAEIGRYCGATALTFNMHVCSCLWSGALADTLDMTSAQREAHERRRRLHFRRIVDEGRLYAQPFSEGGALAAASGAIPFATTARRSGSGWVVNGRKIFASLSGHADYYGVLCTELEGDEAPSRRRTLYLAVAADSPGVTVTGEWDPVGMRGTVSRTLLLQDVEVGPDEAIMPSGVYHQAARRWPHMFLTLSPTYMGIAQAVFDFTVRYLRGEWPGIPERRRGLPAKQANVARMRIVLEQTRALWFQMISEARIDPTPEQWQRALAAQYTVMENANELAQLAIRTCGGQSMLRSLPLERLYRDSRCGSLMLPWTADNVLERLGRDALYAPGERDD